MFLKKIMLALSITASIIASNVVTTFATETEETIEIAQDTTKFDNALAARNLTEIAMSENDIATINMALFDLELPCIGD